MVLRQHSLRIGMLACADVRYRNLFSWHRKCWTHVSHTNSWSLVWTREAGRIHREQGRRRILLDQPLYVWYCSESLACGTPVNRVVQSITTGKAGRIWGGAVVALKFLGPDLSTYSDMSANYHLVSFLTM